MSLSKLQEKIGVTADGAFGPGTLKAAMEYYGFTPEKAAHFFAQTAHESGNFKAFSENLNYSAEGLVKIFGKYFTSATAPKYARNPEKIANKVYSSRMGNGDEKSGDGWKFRGRGALQLTGKDNYKAFTTFIKEDCVANPDLVKNKYFFESALFFFNKNGLLPLATTVTTDSITKISKRVNGGTHGLEDRIVQTNKFYKQIKG